VCNGQTLTHTPIQATTIQVHYQYLTACYTASGSIRHLCRDRWQFCINTQQHIAIPGTSRVNGARHMLREAYTT
jgi:hypothetical protein